MHRIGKRSGLKRAFTLVEMVLVVGIIVILATALFMGVTDLMNTANAADDAVAQGSQKLENNIELSEDQLENYSF